MTICLVLEKVEISLVKISIFLTFLVIIEIKMIFVILKNV